MRVCLCDGVGVYGDVDTERVVEMRTCVYTCYASVGYSHAWG